MTADSTPLGEVDATRRLTVRRLLNLDAARSALPEVLAGARELDRPVRWVRECSGWQDAGHAEAGDLVILSSPGDGAASDATAAIAALAEAGVAALWFPLGHGAPAALVETADHLGLPLIALRGTTEPGRIAQEALTVVLRRTATIQRSMLRAEAHLLQTVAGGGSIDELLTALAQLLDNPVALLAANGQLIAAANPTRLPRDPFDSWPAPPDSGELVAMADLPAPDNEPARCLRSYSSGVPLPEFTTPLLEHAAGLASIISPTAPARARDARMRFDAMQAMRGDDTLPSVSARLRRAGFRPDRSHLIPFVIRNDRDSFLEIDEWGDVAISIQEQWPGGQESLIVSRTDDSSVHGLLAVRSSADRTRAPQALASIVATVFDSIELLPPHLVVGEPVPLKEVRDELIATTQAAFVLSARGEHADHGAWVRARSVELARYLWTLRASADAPLFVRRALGRLTTAPAGQDHLLTTLRVYCETLGQKAEAARRLHLNRQTLYARLQRIEEIAEVDLDDPETIVMLYLALRLHSA